MKQILLLALTFLSLSGAAYGAGISPAMWPLSNDLDTDKPFIKPLHQIQVGFDTPLKIMDDTMKVTVTSEGETYAESAFLEIRNNTDNYVRGLLVVNFDKLDLPKGKQYTVNLPEGIVGRWQEDEEPDATQLVNVAYRWQISVPCALSAPEYQEPVTLSTSDECPAFFYHFETNQLSGKTFTLYREGEKIADFAADIENYDWGLSMIKPHFPEKMYFDKDVQYRLVLNQGTISSVYRPDIANPEVTVDFRGYYTDPLTPFSYTWCSLYTDHSTVLGEVTFTYDRSIKLGENPKIQLYEIDGEETLVKEVTPWINTDVNCWLLVADFGGIDMSRRSFCIVIPDGTVLSADEMDIPCARSELKVGGSSSIDSITPANRNDAPVFDLNGNRVATPEPGKIYISNGRKFILR